MRGYQIIGALVVAFASPCLVGTASASACDDSCRIRAADAYVRALVSHDARDVPFADDARRIENGLLTGCSGDDIRVQLEHGPHYWFIQRIYDVRWSVIGNEVQGTYLLDASLPAIPIRLATVQITERFVVSDDGRIRFIEASIR
ncbi:hypothetical protein LVJ94_11405 [Pendulispora rubella]|uniref:DUF8021 domain-containing protein n=1 Tax=Pendulispora rubella TaxID=2741070 RepID=A0ABZ2LA86_9BACT